MPPPRARTRPDFLGSGDFSATWWSCSSCSATEPFTYERFEIGRADQHPAKEGLVRRPVYIVGKDDTHDSGAKRFDGHRLKIRCPFCRTRRGRPRYHFHGTGGEFGVGRPGVYFGHRLSDCLDHELPRYLRDCSLGYFLVDLAAIKMRESDMRSLFAEMDAVADGYRRPFAEDIREILRVEFRFLQRRRQPELTTEQWQDLFSVWFDHWRGGEEVKQTQMRERGEQLLAQRNELFLQRRVLPAESAQRAAIDRELLEIGGELAAIACGDRPDPTPLGTWVGS